MGKPLLELRGVSAGYGGQQVLRDVSLEVAEGFGRALIAQDDLGETLSKVNIGTGVQEDFALTSDNYGPALGYTSNGSVLFSLEGTGGTVFMLWRFGCTLATPLQNSPMAGFVLPAH